MVYDTWSQKSEILHSIYPDRASYTEKCSHMNWAHWLPGFLLRRTVSTSYSINLGCKLIKSSRTLNAKAIYSPWSEHVICVYVCVCVCAYSRGTQWAWPKTSQ